MILKKGYIFVERLIWLKLKHSWVISILQPTQFAYTTFLK